MHYYQFNIGDYSSKTSHLEPLEDLAYRRMIDLYVKTERPLPLDIQEIARLIRMRSHIECIETVLRDFFITSDDGFVDTDIQKIVDSFKSKSEKAKKSAEARWKKESSNSGEKGNANAMRTHSDGNANHKPITNNHKPITTNQSYSDDFLNFWKAYPNKKDKKAAYDKWKKIKPSPELVSTMLKAIDNQCKEKKYLTDNNKFCPEWKNPATWLNKGSWEDEVKITGIEIKQRKSALEGL